MTSTYGTSDRQTDKYQIWHNPRPWNNTHHQRGIPASEKNINVVAQ
jgi:hypothetical protein